MPKADVAAFDDVRTTNRCGFCDQTATIESKIGVAGANREDSMQLTYAGDGARGCNFVICDDWGVIIDAA